MVVIKQIHSIKSNRYRKLKNPKASYIFDQRSVLSVICDKCSSKDEKVFKEKPILDSWFN